MGFSSEFTGFAAAASRCCLACRAQTRVGTLTDISGLSFTTFLDPLQHRHVPVSRENMCWKSPVVLAAAAGNFACFYVRGSISTGFLRAAQQNSNFDINRDL